MSDRARQFAAFSPLRGYDELLRKKEKVIVPKKDLAEEYIRELSDKLGKIQKGMMVEVIHYKDGEYLSTIGIVSKIDLYLKKLIIVKKEISFDDIYDVTEKANLGIG